MNHKDLKSLREANRILFMALNSIELNILEEVSLLNNHISAGTLTKGVVKKACRRITSIIINNQAINKHFNLNQDDIG